MHKRLKDRAYRLDEGIDLEHVQQVPHEGVPFGGAKKVVLQGSVSVVDQVTRLLVLHLCSTPPRRQSLRQSLRDPRVPLSATLACPRAPFWHAIRSLGPELPGVFLLFPLLQRAALQPGSPTLAQKVRGLGFRV